MWNSLNCCHCCTPMELTVSSSFCTFTLSTLVQLFTSALCDIMSMSKRCKVHSSCFVSFFQGFPVQQYGSGGMSGYPNQPLQYPSGPQQRCAPSPSYPSSRLPLMNQYSSGSHNSAQFPPGGGQPNPPQYYKVRTERCGIFWHGSLKTQDVM